MNLPKKGTIHTYEKINGPEGSLRRAIIEKNQKQILIVLEPPAPLYTALYEVKIKKLETSKSPILVYVHPDSILIPQ